MVRILSACELCEDLSRPQSLFGMHASLPLTQPAQSRYDMSAYILYQNQTIPEKWGGSLGEQACLLECGMPCEQWLRRWQDVLLSSQARMSMIPRSWICRSL